MRGLLDKIKNLVVYDADREFYAKVFPDSVDKKDLLRLRIMTHADLPGVLEIEEKTTNSPGKKTYLQTVLKQVTVAGYVNYKIKY